MNHKQKVEGLFAKHDALINKKNTPVENGNGVYTRYENPIVTAAHTPVFRDMI